MAVTMLYGITCMVFWCLFLKCFWLQWYSFTPMMVTAEEIVGPGRNLIQSPVTGWDVILFKGFFFSVGLEAIIGAHVDALLFPRKDFTPSFHRTSALAVEEVFGALGLRTQESNLQKRTVAAAAATGTDELDPVFQLGNRAFKPGAINLLKEPSARFVKRSF